MSFTVLRRVPNNRYLFRPYRTLTDYNDEEIIVPVLRWTSSMGVFGLLLKSPPNISIL